MNRSWHLVTFFAVLCCPVLAISSPALADTPLDGSTWSSDNCHFDSIVFYSAVGANLHYKGDDSLLGWQEPFDVDTKTYTVTITPFHDNSDEDNDAFTGLYSTSGDGKLVTLVGYHHWRDTKGTHNERCSYRLTDMTPDQ
jgi:hypothetical protein